MHTRGGKGSSRGHKQKKIRTNTHTLSRDGPTRALPERNLPAPPPRIFPRPETVCPHNRVRRGTSHSSTDVVVVASGNNVPPGETVPSSAKSNQNKTTLKFDSRRRPRTVQRDHFSLASCEPTTESRRVCGREAEVARRRRRRRVQTRNFLDFEGSEPRIWPESRTVGNARALKAWRNTERIVQLSFSTGQIYDFAICLPFFLRDDGSVLVDSVELFFHAT